MAKTDNSQGILLAAIIAKHLGESSLTDAMKGPWTFSKPERHASEKDYAIIIPGLSVDDGWTCKNEYYSHRPEFRFYGKSPELANASVNIWLAVFDVESLSLSLSDGRVISHRVKSIGMVEPEARSVDYATVTMQFRTSKPR